MGYDPAALTLTTIAALFDRQGWRYQIIENHLVTVFDGVPIVVDVDDERAIVMLQTPIAPGRGMPGYLPASAEAERDAAIYMLSVNYRLALGAYTRDHQDGEIRYEISFPAAGASVSEEQILHAVSVIVATMLSHAPVVNALLTSRISLRQALDQLERGQGGLPPAMAV